MGDWPQGYQEFKYSLGLWSNHKLMKRYICLLVEGKTLERSADVSWGDNELEMHNAIVIAFLNERSFRR